VLDDNGEQILARESGPHTSDVRLHHGGFVPKTMSPLTGGASVVLVRLSPRRARSSRLV
jgi:hypothetical protein